MKIPPVKEQSRPGPRAAARRGLLVDLRSVPASAGLTAVVEGSGDRLKDLNFSGSHGAFRREAGSRVSSGQLPRAREMRTEVGGKVSRGLWEPRGSGFREWGWGPAGEEWQSVGKGPGTGP